MQSTPSFFSISGLARASARRPWLVVAGWVLALVLAVGAMGILGDATTTEVTFLDNPESMRGNDLLVESGLRSKDPITETVIVRSDAATVDDAAMRAVVDRTAADLRALSGVVIPASVTTYYDAGPGSPQADALVSPDGRTTLIPVTLVGTLDDATAHAEEFFGAIEHQGVAGIEVLTVGQLSVAEEQNTIAEEDLVRGETIGIAVALIILVAVFAALVAAGVPLVLAVVSIAVAFGLTAVAGRILELSFFVTNMITMIGLGGRDRLRPLRRRALPRGAPARRRQARRDRHRRGNGQQGGPLLGDDGGRRAERDVPPPEQHLPLARSRCDPGRGGRGRGGPDADPGRALAPRRPHRLAAQTAVRRADGRRASRLRPRDDPPRVLGPDHPRGDGPAADQRRRWP